MAASEPQWVATCARVDLDAATGTCAHIVWVEQQPPTVGVLPPLTATEGLQISAAVAGCWAIGFLVRVFRKQLGV